jgi:hypothetical protein
MNVTSPIVVDMGSAQKKHVGDLRKGAGPITEDIEEVMRLVRLNADPGGEKRVFLPVVVVYGRR